MTNNTSKKYEFLYNCKIVKSVEGTEITFKPVYTPIYVSGGGYDSHIQLNKYEDVLK